MAVSVHAQQKIGKKIPETVVQFPKFLVISKTGHGEFEYGSNVTPEVVLWPFLCMHTKSGHSGPKHSQMGKNSGSVRNWGQRT